MTDVLPLATSNHRRAREGSNVEADRQAPARDPEATTPSTLEGHPDFVPPQIASQIARLKFADPAIEADFQLENDALSLGSFRVSLAIGVMCFPFWSWVDTRLAPEYIGISWPIRIGGGCSLCLGVLIATYFGRFQVRLSARRFAFSLLNGLVVIACCVVNGPVGHSQYYAGIMLNDLAFSVAAGQRFRSSAISMWALFGVYEVAMLLDPDASPRIMLNNSAFLIAFNLLATGVSYSIERHLRTGFSQRRIILEQSAALSEALREVKRAAITDPLTGLFNRRHFFEEASRGMERVSVIILDVDHFKSINDRFGHSAGDRVLREVSERVRGRIRGLDIACRYGGEEFAVLLPGADLSVSAHLGERLREVIEAEPFDIGDQSLRVTVSVGVASVSEESFGIEALVDRADRALYQAKNAGRNRVKLWDRDEPFEQAG